VLRLTLFAIFELWFFVSSAVLKNPPERKAAKRYQLLLKNNSLPKKMKNTILLFVAMSTISCASNSGFENTVDLKIPDKVETTTKGSKNFPGTRVFVNVPKDYESIPSLIRFQKDVSTYVQCIESPSTSFEARKSEIKKAMDKAIERGLIAYYQKNFKLGNYDAYLIYGKDTKPNQDNFVLLFGDDKFTVMAIGVIPEKNHEKREEVLKSLLSLSVDENFSVDHSAQMAFNVDLTGTDFKFNQIMSNITYYTINGKGDPINNVIETQIMILNLPTIKSDENKIAFSKDILKRIQNNGVNIAKSTDEKTTINGLSAFSTEFEATHKGKTLKGYQVIFGNEKATIILTSSIYENKEVLIEQCKKIANSISIK
jgi:hypothetical protein